MSKEKVKTKEKGVLYESTKYENVKEVIDDAIRKYPQCTAFTIKQKTEKEVTYKKITYRKFGEEINALGTALIDLGLKNERIAVIGKNRYEWALGYFAVLNGVGTVVPLDKGLPEQEIISSIQRSGAKAIIFEKDYMDIMKKLQNGNLTECTTFICMDSNDRFIELENLLKKGQQIIESGNRDYEYTKINNEEMRIILFTSGTTSLSKAVALSHKNIATNIYALNAAEKFYTTDVNIAFLPFHHTFGSTGLLLMLSNGVNNVFCDGLRHIQENLSEYKVSVFICVPLILEAMHKKIMLQVEKQGKTKVIKFGKKLSNMLLKIGIDIRRKLFKDIIEALGGSLRFVVSGAAGIDKQVAEDFNSFGIMTVQGYGLTETSPVLCAENKIAIRYGSVGFPMCNVDLKIDSPDKDGIGEIIAKGPNLMIGYYNNQEATDEVIQNGWFHTGDLGYIDKDGYVYITGRKKNVIVLKNGKNIFPEELELLINNLPYIAESMVFGYPKGEDLIISAKIVYNKEYVQEKYSDLTPKQLEEKVWQDIKEINQGLTNYKHIKKLILTDEPMIKTTTAKIKRFQEIEKILNTN